MSAAVDQVHKDYQEALEEFRAYEGEILSLIDADLWEAYKQARSRVRALCDTVRSEIKISRTPVGDFKLTFASATTWDQKTLLSLARRRGELELLEEGGALEIDPKCAATILGAGFDVYKSEACTVTKGAQARVTAGPKPEDFG